MGTFKSKPPSSIKVRNLREKLRGELETLEMMTVRARGPVGGGSGGGTVPGTKGFGDTDGGSEGDYKFKKLDKTSIISDVFS